ncbi:Ketosamine-3-kinase [Exidia glandulosa HHB12029]|uniref:protein-ribulosamine 3-kinase n=1 Tax=Exidia glandulosa HHB12029 TaxID=1314781 RepID=A0A165BQZ6_EXIGL|nr:Ketosamine-3-kinase [Exidia glandulosa HHB12029]
MLDQAVLDALGLNATSTTVSPHGGSGFSSTYKVTSGEKKYFLKTGRDDDARVMFAGEYASLNAINDVDPTLCPRAHAHGSLEATPGSHFLVTDFLDFQSSSGGPSLAQKLAKLHTTPAPSEGKFGFPATTCCGSTPQPNEPYTTSWAQFFAQNRLAFILKQNEAANGSDPGLRTLVERTIEHVVPSLLGKLDGKITPVVVHGDLWSGNASVGSGQAFDPSACYAHSEYELGIMKMFGGFGGQFMKEYHALVPKTEPVEEYEDRVTLYELYHHLNHNALFGGSYRSGAVSIMKRLLATYESEANL